jgi:8-oxo-dGTP diphosphatase
MAREAKEEVGIDLDPEYLSLSHVMHRNHEDNEADERLDFFFTSRKWTGKISNCEEEKCSELLWAPMDNLPDGVIDYYIEVFDSIRQGEVYSSRGWN